MLERFIHPAHGVTLYRSPLLTQRGIPHAFSTRLGGVSTGPFASLNLGNPSDQPEKDTPENIGENYRRLQEAAGTSSMAGSAPLPRAWVTQIHSNRAELLDAEAEGDYSETFAAVLRDRFQGQLQADALLTEIPGVWLSIRVADCAPILLASSDGRAVAAVHAGWRGAVGGVLPRAIRALGEIGVLPRELIAAIGPSISLPHFEVGPEVADAFDRAQLSPAVDRANFPKPHVNLRHALTLQLHQAGVTQIDAGAPPASPPPSSNSPDSPLPLCTFANPAEFFSHRRDHGRTGRLAALISRPPA